MADGDTNPGPAGGPSTEPTNGASTSGTASTPIVNTPEGNAAATQAAALGSVTFSGDQLTVLLGALSKLSINTSNLGLPADIATNPTPPVTASSFPQFAPTANLPTPGTSLLDIFPSIKASILLDIARHDFEPSDLYKLDTKYRDKATRSVLDFDGTTFTMRDPSTKDDPSFRSMYAPLMTYFNILTAFSASSGNTAYQYQVASGAFFYMTQLEQFNEEYQWSAVLLYHMQFHHKRRRDMARGDYSGWAQVDSALHAQYLCGKERQRASGNSRGTSPKSPAQARDQEVCRLFNKGSCPSPCRNKRVHTCSTCGSADHGQSTCTRGTT